VLDSGVLGRLCAPVVERELEIWVVGLLQRGRKVLIPEVCDYEIRRELIRNRSATIAQLDGLAKTFEYLPITTPAIRRASELWAILRQTGVPTAPDASLDADCRGCDLERGPPRQNGRCESLARGRVAQGLLFGASRFTFGVLASPAKAGAGGRRDAAHRTRRRTSRRRWVTGQLVIGGGPGAGRRAAGAPVNQNASVAPQVTVA
jgi:predicted nucleic acid-binding protein